jgi:hypothetical protein
LSEGVGSQINYRKLLGRHGWIRIPMLQRDYAQGRPEEGEVREGFLTALETALKLPADDPSLPLNLDFIYGSVEGSEKDSRFSPLDGQQRLTTLFLLHWFLAWQDGAWEEFGKLFRGQDGHSRFTYKVRQFSNEFFDKLVVLEPAVRPKAIRSVTELITDQSWYFRNWRLDPTIQSALTMLDAIHQRFKDRTGLFARLTSDEQPAITFQLLDLETFDLSDDLYIKMNARGKPLTSFEHFKAQYEHELAGQFAGKSYRIGDRDYTVAKFVALRMDTTWADFFWVHRDKRTNLYDEVIMNLFRVLALVMRDPENKNYPRDLALLRNEGRPAPYKTFYDNGWLEEEFTETLIALLDQWSDRSRGKTTFQPLLPDTRYFDEMVVFAKLARNSTNLTLTDVIQFAGYVLFIRNYPESITTDAFQEWMRVVGNLSWNTLIERPDDLRSAARGLRELLPKATDILAHLEQLKEKDRVTGFYPPQVTEEQVKAGLIRNHSGWRGLIDRAEQHGYFGGQIDFLCEFSGAMAQWKTARSFAWDEAVHVQLQKTFENYLKKAEAMFRTEGLVPVGEYRWQRALLTLGDYLLSMGWTNQSFLVDAAADPQSWKRLLRGGTYSQAPETLKRPLLKKMWDKLTDGPPITEQLDAIISSASGLPPWREDLVRTPKAIEYCGKRAIRRDSDTQIYLLKKIRMSGQHVELFTYCLHEELETPAQRERLKPLSLGTYGFQNDTSDEPYLQFHFKHQKALLSFYVYFTGGKFRTWTPLAPLEPFPTLKKLLTDQADFAADVECEDWLVKTNSRDQIEAALADLAALLATAPEGLANS